MTSKDVEVIGDPSKNIATFTFQTKKARIFQSNINSATLDGVLTITSNDINALLDKLRDESLSFSFKLAM